MKNSPLIIFLLCQIATLGQCHDSTNLFEGDIVPDYGSISAAYGNSTVNDLIEKGDIEEPKQLGRGTSPTFPLWRETMNKNDLYVIKVYINPIDYQESQVILVKRALKELQRKSGVLKFNFMSVQPINGVPYLNYGRNGGGRCASYVGRNGFAKRADGQPIFLDYPCLEKGTIQHETMHSLGFWHEQSRPDRDGFITILYENVQDDMTNNFDKQSNIDSLGAPYDYDSVMHYHATAFGNGKKTIDSRGHDIGQREGISRGDKIQLRLLYQCSTGPRKYSLFKSEKCTADCKCGKNWKGCSTDGDDDSTVCKGRLQCRDNKCIKVKA
eukprot:scaffold161_cov206-Chaetoceros_neogracile.AAC.2